jgi:hypothetical protein
VSNAVPTPGRVINLDTCAFRKQGSRFCIGAFARHSLAPQQTYKLKRIYFGDVENSNPSRSGHTLQQVADSALGAAKKGLTDASGMLIVYTTH